ncbi:hypothetical protein KGP17_11835 [Serratia sp. JSRIV001]|uniref:hypothetical protein n=1 Tax=Serratia sp. JSRIV001 TaxID=2831893 RepID=UPI001CBABE66|nr:hypothetical protein [Serratia sp. JSRIV001]UAN48161.1 hypothetical protein KGP17_11835 [Serratia sp. JSRIV001]
MTSVVCWLNNDEYFPGIWAVSDSRVSSNGGVMTDSLQKLFAIPLNLYGEDDLILKQNPKKILNVGFGFAGSTLIGSSVKEILTICLDNLSEIAYYDKAGTVDVSIDKRTPSIEEIALLTGRIAKNYLLSMGFCYPKSARCEMVIFGYCPKEKTNRIFLIKNSPARPEVILVEEQAVGEDTYVILGDKKNEVYEMISKKNEICKLTPFDQGRGPIVALQQIIKDEAVTTIGGHVQICITTSSMARIMYVSILSEFKFSPFLGFDFSDIGTLGGFTINVSPGMSINEKLLD